MYNPRTVRDRIPTVCSTSIHVSPSSRPHPSSNAFHDILRPGPSSPSPPISGSPAPPNPGASTWHLPADKVGAGCLLAPGARGPHPSLTTKSPVQGRGSMALTLLMGPCRKPPTDSSGATKTANYTTTLTHPWRPKPALVGGSPPKTGNMTCISDLWK